MMVSALTVLLMAVCVALLRAEVHLARLRMQVRTLELRVSQQRDVSLDLLAGMRSLRASGLTVEEARVRALCAASQGQHLRLVDRVRAAEGDVSARNGFDGGAA